MVGRQMGPLLKENYKLSCGDDTHMLKRVILCLVMAVLYVRGRFPNARGGGDGEEGGGGGRNADGGGTVWIK